MERHLLLAFTSPVDGEENQYNDWYSDVHVREVLCTKGFVGGERFRLAEGEDPANAPSPYLAIFEVEGDWKSAKDALMADRAKRTAISPALGPERTLAWYTSITDRKVSGPEDAWEQNQQ